MCRLAYIPYKSLFLPWLPDFLTDMEKDYGGHGMGIASGKRMLKGTGLDVKDCLNFAQRRSGNPIIWHTRWVSSGTKTDELCHPFPCDGGHLVHNGHWLDGATAAPLLDDIAGSEFSDTRVFAFLCHRLSFWEAALKYAPSGIWLYLKKGQLELYAGSGDLFHDPETDILASQPPTDQKGWKRVKCGFVYRGIGKLEYEDRAWSGKITWRGKNEKKVEPKDCDTPMNLELGPATDTPEAAAGELELMWNDKDQAAAGPWSHD